MGRPNLLFPSKTGCIVEITDDTAISKMQFRSEIKISHAAKTPPPIQMFPLRFLSSDQGSRRASVATIPAALPAQAPVFLGTRHSPKRFRGSNREVCYWPEEHDGEQHPVYRPNGDRVGQIERIMIDKLCGKVAYAVMSFGGFLGIGEDYYPLLWSLLTFNPALDGYEVNVTEQQLKGPPKFSKYAHAVFPGAKGPFERRLR
jgi:PRC-barrel domain protein